MTTIATVVLVIVVLLALAMGTAFTMDRARRLRLQSRFGPEYDRAVAEGDSRRSAERELAEREKQHQQLSVRALTQDAQNRYVQQWALVQEEFVDQPGRAVTDADQLIAAVMAERGYPTSGFHQQAAHLSVEHSGTIDNYRTAHAILRNHQRSQASTEDLRTAMVHYRTLFQDLVQSGQQADPRSGAA